MNFLGLDVGTQGARAVVASPETTARHSAVLAEAARPFPAGTTPADLPPGHAEQHPHGWWQAVTACLREVTSQVRAETIQALAVTSTSGTLCLLDCLGKPLGPALMYNDARSNREAAEVQDAGAEQAARLGYRFNASYALAKLLWLARHRPALLESARHISHAADYIVGRLSGVYDVTDFSNALKTGCELAPRDGGPPGCWPGFISEKLGLPVAKLPRVVAPGEVIGGVSREAANATGLRAGTLVVAGMTDGCAAQIASGAVAPGDWCSTLGTTLVIKGVTRRLVRDPLGRIYSHRHPEGYWLPGGASNVGGEILAARFAGADLAALDREALARSPSDLIAYPLARHGERFPFLKPKAEPFLLSFDANAPVQPVAEEALFTAYLEGVGYVERLAYETLEALGAPVGGTIHVAGGGARSDVWLQIRADVLGKTLLRPAEPGAALGAAILAASRTHFSGVIEAARAMSRIDRVIEPRGALTSAYTARYARFRAACVERGYIA